MQARLFRASTVVALVAAALSVTAASAAELRFFTAVAMQEITTELVPKFERATGHKLVLTVDNLGGLMKRFEAGESADLILLPAGGIAALVRQGKATEEEIRPIARSLVGVAVRKGTPKPDISSPEAFRQSMLAAKSVFISDPAQGGFVTPHLFKVFEQLGIAEEMKRKTVFSKAPGTAGIEQTIASTDSNVGLNQLQEFAPLAAMEIVGPLPGDLGLATPFNATLGAGTREKAAARAFIDFMRTADAAAVIRAKGMEPAPVPAQSCTASPIAVQILGSGGPAVNKDRASTSYLLWIDGRARMVVDMGGGAFLRFGQAEARLSDLSLAAMSHFHPDHVSDLPALMWLSSFTRKEPLPIVGPSGNALVPGLPEFLSRLFDAKTGAFQVLGTSMGASAVPGVGGGVKLDVSTVDVTKNEPSTVFDRDGLQVTALTIPHGNIPAVAYRVQTRSGSVVFSSDQNGTNPRFVEFARGANLLIMHLAIPAGATNPLHAAPAVVGRVAQEAGVGRLIVSHIGPFNLDAAIAELKTQYTGPLTVGADLQCTALQ